MKIIQIILILGLVFWCLQCNIKRPSSLIAVQFCFENQDTCNCEKTYVFEKSKQSTTIFNTKSFKCLGHLPESVPKNHYLYKIETIRFIMTIPNE